jgi:hypothetical protein
MAADFEADDEQSGREVDDRADRAVRAIRPCLPTLVGERAAELDEQLRKRLGGPNATDAAVDLLNEDLATQAWLAEFFETGLPPEIGERFERGYSRLPGNPAPGRPRRYTCPMDGKYDWYRVEFADEVPECPDHPGSRLVPAS